MIGTSRCEEFKQLAQNLLNNIQGVQLAQTAVTCSTLYGGDGLSLNLSVRKSLVNGTLRFSVLSEAVSTPLNGYDETHLLGRK